jgi:hypothetical protein
MFCINSLGLKGILAILFIGFEENFLENIHFDLNFVDQMVDLMPFPIEGIQQ